MSLHEALSATATPLRFHKDGVASRQVLHQQRGGVQSHDDSAMTADFHNQSRHSAVVEGSPQISMAEVTAFTDDCSPILHAAPEEDRREYDYHRTSSPSTSTKQQQLPVAKTSTPVRPSAPVIPAERFLSSKDHNAQHITSPSKAIKFEPTAPTEGRALLTQIDHPHHHHHTQQQEQQQQREDAAQRELEHLRRRNQQLEAHLLTVLDENSRMAAELQELEATNRDTSTCRDDREQECLELNEMVDRLQFQLRAMSEKALAAEARAQRAADEARQSGRAAQRLQEERAVHARELDDHAQTTRKYQAQVVALKVQLAEYQSILDRLGLHPPFDEGLMGVARIKLRHIAKERQREEEQGVGKPTAAAAAAVVHPAERIVPTPSHHRVSPTHDLAMMRPSSSGTASHQAPFRPPHGRSVESGVNRSTTPKGPMHSTLDAMTKEPRAQQQGPATTVERFAPPPRTRRPLPVTTPASPEQKPTPGLRPSADTADTARSRTGSRERSSSSNREHAFAPTAAATSNTAFASGGHEDVCDALSSINVTADSSVQLRSFTEAPSYGPDGGRVVMAPPRLSGTPRYRSPVQRGDPSTTASSSSRRY